MLASILWSKVLTPWWRRRRAVVAAAFVGRVTGVAEASRRPWFQRSAVSASYVAQAWLGC
ncbi:hypothetical protein FE697_001075 [Mumia zhuanghuii]|uniref:Secreted protein n=2 Tax=Mumia TaxID=1546255 RepID=A0ABW1QH35_9ACTN|nr:MULTISPECIES: hypothetical protein [Mumia]KAA1424554.1 hypothetical protein FE697_001075 [Mumia zhuanghuii]